MSKFWTIYQTLVLKIFELIRDKLKIFSINEYLGLELLERGKSRRRNE